MSLVFHGVIFQSNEATARSHFTSLDSTLPLRLVRLDDGVFGIYAKRDGDAPSELQQIAGLVSQTEGLTLFYWSDSRVGPWYQLYENGQVTRELNVCDPSLNTWGDGDALEAIGVSESLHDAVEEAFLWDTPGPLLHNRPEWDEVRDRFPIGTPVRGTVAEHLPRSGVFVDLGDPVARGFVKISELSDNGEAAPEQLPPVGASLEAEVAGHSDERQLLILLRVKRSG